MPRSLQLWQKDLVNKLRQLAKLSDKSHGQSYLGTDLAYLGLKSVQYKTLVRQIEKDLPAKWEVCVETLWNTPIFETRILAILLAERFQKEFKPTHWKLFSGWLKESVGWAMVDTLCDSTLVPMLLKYPELAEKTNSWVNSKNLWIRRGSLVAFCKPLRKGYFSDYGFAHAEKLMHDRDPMIVKAMSWVLREASKKFRKQTEMFIKEKESQLAPMVLREVRIKLKTGTKSGKLARK